MSYEEQKAQEQIEAGIYHEEQKNNFLQENKMEQLEELLKHWKAAKIECADRGDYSGANHWDYRTRGLNAALTCLARLSNTTIHTDTKPCSSCGTYRQHFNNYVFCPMCSRALNE